MYLLTNKDKIDVGLPAAVFGAVVIAVGGSVEVSDDHYRELIKSLYTKDAIARGTVGVERTKNKPQSKESKRGIKLEKQKSDLWKVYINGHLVTGIAVSKEEAERIAADY